MERSLGIDIMNNEEERDIGEGGRERQQRQERKV
jgi:hypothetical protein